jgi:hypothetical protein
MFILNILLQASAVEHLLDNLTEKSIVYTLLIFVIGYLIWKLHHKEKEVTELQKTIRENEKENMSILTQVSATLDRVIEGQRTTNEMIFRELQSLKDFVRYLIENATIKKK